MSRLLVALAAVALSALSAPAASAAGPMPCGRTGLHMPKLHVVGNHHEYSDGKRFVPYGISLVGGPETRYWVATERAAMAQIVASKRYWGANTVRVQVGEALLLDRPSRGHSYNVPFAASVNRLVCRILRQKQIPVISDTTLFTTQSRGPTARSIRFWEFMSSRYGNRYPVIFDIFNEPRLGRNPANNRFYPLSYVWRLWETGGRIAGRRYTGMQRLVDTIRKRHVRNVIWAEEPWYLDPDKLPTAQLPDHLLKGNDIVYAFHKVTLNERSRSFQALQQVAAKGIPLVDSEWAQFAATRRPWECQEDAEKGVRGFFAFVQRSQIGLIAWSLQPGALVRGVAGVDTVHDGNDYRFTTNPAALATPNRMNASYSCHAPSRGQGAGALVQDYFKRYSFAARFSTLTPLPHFG